MNYLTSLRRLLKWLAFVTAIIAGLCASSAKDAFDLTLRSVDLKNINSIGSDYASGAGKLGFFINGHGLPDRHLTFVILRTPKDGKNELIWPALGYGSAVVLDGRIVFSARMSDYSPALMEHNADGPPVVISPAVLRLAARRLGPSVVAPGQDYFFSEVRLPPGRIWLKASKLNTSAYAPEKAFSVELTSADLEQIVNESIERGKKSKIKRFDYIAEPVSFTHLESSIEMTNATVQVPRIVGPYVPEDEHLYGNGLIDSSNHYAYFSTAHQPGRILKVALGQGAAEAPKIVGAVVLEPEEDDCFYGTLGSDGDYAYFIAKYGRLVKIALGAGSEPPRRVGSIPVDENYGIRVSVVDSKLGYGCFAGRGKFYKVKLGKGDELPSVVSSLSLTNNIGEEMASAVLDVNTHQAYFGSDYKHIYKVAIGEGDAPLTLSGQIEVPDDEGGFRGALINSEVGCGWFISNRGHIVKISLGEGAHPPQVLGTLHLPSRFRYLEYTFGRDNEGYGYFGTVHGGDADAAVLKVDLGRSPQDLPRLSAILPMRPGEDYVVGGVADASTRTVCLGLGSGPCFLQKVSMGDEASSPKITAKTLLSRR